ncbi:RNA polymerase subunit sigma [Streptomyces sp. NPDC085900]|uniref:RNA polymerase subunit sigma n=1 Tax=Streptomyces sp. NPDC085900 TaxID=3365737 RepID=UPI0037D6D5A2
MDQGDAVPLAELLEERRFLLDVAHGTLGSADAAESVVDETYRRWYGLSDAARRRITVPRSWLAETVGGICREAERETDRLVANPSPAAASRTSEAALGTITDPGAARRGRLRWRRWGARKSWGSRRSWASRRHETVARAVCRACVAEDGELLVSLLRPDVTALFDGGGKVRVPTGPVHGGRAVAESLLTLLGARPGPTLSARSVNGRTGLVARHGNLVVAVIGLDVTGGRVARFWIVLNPDKLRPWNRPSAYSASPSKSPGTEKGPPQTSACEGPSHRRDDRI